MAKTATKIERGMDFDKWREAWFDLVREQGHVLKTDEDFGGVNEFVTSGVYCNGPGCSKCGPPRQTLRCDRCAEKLKNFDVPTGVGIIR